MLFKSVMSMVSSNIRGQKI